MIRVLVGENENEKGFLNAARTGGAGPWIVPKDSEFGDDVVFLFRRSKFLGTGMIGSLPTRTTFGRKKAYQAVVRKLRRFVRPLSLETVREAIPDWGWARYPRHYTTARGAVEDRLRRLLPATRASGPKSAPKPRRLTPGSLVRHRRHPELGVGIVRTIRAGKVSVVFDKARSTRAATVGRREITITWTAP
jgi:Protein of unknown function (DUF3553)